jgi:type I restriction enzyme S subunit
VKIGWQLKPLVELCEFTRGLTYSKGDEVATSGSIVLRATNIDLGTSRLDLRDLRYISESVEVPRSKTVRRNSLLICTASGSKNHLGKVAFIDRDYGYAFGGFMGMITPSSALVPRYLFHLMTSPLYSGFIDQLADGANINNLKYDDLRGFHVPLPPFNEQQRIVAILDEAFAAIATAKANAEKKLQNARALFERTRDTEFTQCTGKYGTVRIDALCESIMDCVNKTAPKVDGPTEYKMVRTTNIRHGRVSLSDVYYVTEEVFTQWTRRQQPTKGDVLLTREAPLGELGMIETDDKIFLGQRIVSYRANPTKLDSKFLLFGMQSAELQNQMKAKASGATVQHMRVPDTKTLQFPSVPLSEQKRLVQKLVALADMTQILESLCRRKLAALDELKQSLLHRAFNGDL